METFFPSPSMRESLKRISGVPWHTIGKPLPILLALCMNLLSWTPQMSNRSLISEDEKKSKMTFFFHFPTTTYHFPPPFFPSSYFLLSFIFLLYVFTKLWQSSDCGFGESCQMSQKSHTQHTHIHTHTKKMMFWERNIQGFLVKISNQHQISSNLALVCIPSLCILFLLLFALSKAYTHGKHCNYLSLS